MKGWPQQEATTSNNNCAIDPTAINRNQANSSPVQFASHSGHFRSDCDSPGARRQRGEPKLLSSSSYVRLPSASSLEPTKRILVVKKADSSSERASSGENDDDDDDNSDNDHDNEHSGQMRSSSELATPRTALETARRPASSTTTMGACQTNDGGGGGDDDAEKHKPADGGLTAHLDGGAHLQQLNAGTSGKCSDNQDSRPSGASSSSSGSGSANTSRISSSSSSSTGASGSGTSARTSNDTGKEDDYASLSLVADLNYRPIESSGSHPRVKRHQPHPLQWVSSSGAATANNKATNSIGCNKPESLFKREATVRFSLVELELAGGVQCSLAAAGPSPLAALKTKTTTNTTTTIDRAIKWILANIRPNNSSSSTNSNCAAKSANNKLQEAREVDVSCSVNSECQGQLEPLLESDHTGNETQQRQDEEEDCNKLGKSIRAFVGREEEENQETSCDYGTIAKNMSRTDDSSIVSSIIRKFHSTTKSGLANSNSNSNNNNNLSNVSISKQKPMIEDYNDNSSSNQQTATTIASSGDNKSLENAQVVDRRRRRSTYCSSIGAITSDLNFDSSLSSANVNCGSDNHTNRHTMMVNQTIAATSINLHDNSEGETELIKHGDDSIYSNRLPIQPQKNQQQQQHKRSQCKIKMDIKALASQPLKARENWDKNIEFLLAVIGFAVDLGNVWRFPYICYKNGGGAFLIPYTVMFILGGLPIFYLEMSLGQYFSSGCLTIWKRVCPMAKGIGYAMCVLNFFTSLYYNTIISWAVFFFVESFTTVLPWTNCDNLWNSKNCKTIAQRQSSRLINDSMTNSTFDINNPLIANQSQPIVFDSPTKEYFEYQVLKVNESKGIDDLGPIRTPLAIYLAIVFICIYFAIWKGVKSTGKAVWITALLPYFVLIPLLIRGVLLEGAWLGIKYYLYPDWVKILDVVVWVEAAKQIYFSLGPGFGTLMALSSYNKFNHNCQKDALIAATVNYFASFIAGLVIFAVLGYMATIENVSINDVATEGPGLVFQVYPEGLATMSFSPMWSIFFFIMVITLGIDSTFGGLESVITGLCDEYPRVLRAHRGIFIGLLIVLIYLCSLPTTTYGGNYVIYVLESYGTSLSLLFIVLIETIIVCWLYGADRFCKNLEEMHGKRPGAYWRICWKYISPTILLLIFIAACGQELDKYHTLKNGNYTYPGWAPTLGLLMTGSSLCCVPIYAIYYLKNKTSGSFLERIKIASRPIVGEIKDEKDLYVDALTNKIRDDNITHHDTVI